METLVKSAAPEQQGIASEAISAFIDEANETIHDLHSLILLRHGQIVAEGYWSPFEAKDPHIMFSLSKSFTSTAVGFAVAEGLLKVTDPVISFFPEETPVDISDNLAAMQVKHLLSMSTGHAEDTTYAILEPSTQNWAKAILAFPVVYEPGTHFLYNTGATFLLSAIVQKLSGQPLLEYLEPRLFKPLGIENPSWENNPQGINTGGFGLGIKTSDIARFGQFYLQKGVWQGQQLLPEAWIEEATSSHISNGTDPASDWAQGYGYQFWRCQNGAYRGDGAFGQYCVVMPEQDAVLAITSSLMDMQAVLSLVWKHLLPAMQPQALPENPIASEELVRKLAGLNLAPATDLPSDTVAARVSGKTFLIAENDVQAKSFKFDFDGPNNQLTVEEITGSNQIEVGSGEWRIGQTKMISGLPRKVASSGGWTNSDTYVAKLYFLTPALVKNPPAMVVRGIPFCLTITSRFADDQVFIELQPNAAFGDNLPIKLQGHTA